MFLLLSLSSLSSLLSSPFDVVMCHRSLFMWL